MQQEIIKQTMQLKYLELNFDSKIKTFKEI